MLVRGNGLRQLRRYVYADNLGVLGDDQAAVESALSEMVKVFEGMDLLAHGEEVKCDVVEAPGVTLGGRL